MTEQMAYKSRMTVGGTAVEFLTHSIKETREIAEDDGIRGSRSRVFERVAQGQISVAGQIEFEPTPLELEKLLPLLVGSSTSATVLTDALADFNVVIDNGTKTDTFVGRFSKGTLSGQSGQKIKLTVDFVGKSRTQGAGGSLSGTPDITARPYMFFDLGSGIEIDGTSYLIDRFELVIDNMIDPTYMIGQEATDLEPTDRTVSLGIQTKFNSAESALLDLAMAAPDISDPLTAELVLTNGAKSATFTFGALVAKAESVVNQGKRTKLRLPLNYNCYRVGTNLEVVPVLA